MLVTWFNHAHSATMTAQRNMSQHERVNKPDIVSVNNKDG